jgi:hypothetical protein
MLMMALVGLANAAGASVHQVFVTRTNIVERWLTNEVEVRVPLNRFVTEYRTNYVDQVRTNVVDVYTTNLFVRTLTNRFEICRTNWTILNLTNWSTVLVFKTNWINQPLTNTVQIALPVTPPPTAAAPAPRAPAGPLALEARRGARALPNDQVDVILLVRWNTDSSAPLRVRQWRVESDDHAFLCFGEEQKFARPLHAGKYQVQVKVQSGENTALLTARGTLLVNARDVLLQQGLIASR